MLVGGLLYLFPTLLMSRLYPGSHIMGAGMLSMETISLLIATARTATDL